MSPEITTWPLVNTFLEIPSSLYPFSALAPAKLNRLWALYNTEATELGQETTPEGAEALANRFAIHYQHAVPFDRRVLDDAWRRCKGERCEIERRETMADLGLLPRKPGRARPGTP